MEAIIKKTQDELGAVIRAPKLTEKLLGRPPFRYIHDIVMSVLKTANFPDGLYTEDQQDSGRVTDKKAKLDFLEQLITVVEAATGASTGARPAKIAAGEEPEKTNELLQALAKCATLPAAQKQAAVQKVKGGDAGAAAANPPAPAATPTPAAAPSTKATETEEERQKRKEEERRRRHDEKKKEQEKAAKAAAKAKEEAEPAKADEPPAAAADAERRRRREEKKRAAAAAAAGGSTSTGSAAASPSSPTAEAKASPAAAGAAATTASARKAPPRTKPTHEVIDAQRGAAAAPVAGVIREGKHNAAEASDEDEGGEQDWQKVAEQYDAKPAARTAAVAEDADVKGLLGQQALKAKRDQEAAARRGEDAATATAASAAPSSGGIVIRSSKNMATRGGGGHALGDSDLNQLREQLQMLTKASNPLGKFLEAIHDDIDSMTRELEMWRSESRNQSIAAAEARRQTEESLQEIHANLQNLEDAISDQMLKSNNLRQTILANDAAIEAMMKTIVNPDIAAQ